MFCTSQSNNLGYISLAEFLELMIKKSFLSQHHLKANINLHMNSCKIMTDRETAVLIYACISEILFILSEHFLPQAIKSDEIRVCIDQKDGILKLTIQSICQEVCENLKGFKDKENAFVVVNSLLEKFKGSIKICYEQIKGSKYEILLPVNSLGTFKQGAFLHDI